MSARAFAPLALLATLCLLFCSCRSELETRAWKEVSASFSPDGSSCAVIARALSSSDSVLELLVLPSGSTETKTLASDVSPVMAPVYAPDSKRVFYLKRGSFHMLLMSVPLSGGPSVELASLRVSPQHLKCLPSARGIAFVSFMKGWWGVDSSIDFYDFATGALTELPALPGYAVESAALSAKGDVLVYSDGKRVWRLNPTAPALPPLEITASMPKPLDRPTQFALSPDASKLCLRLGRLERRSEGAPDGDFSSVDHAKIHYKTVDMRRLLIVDLNKPKDGSFSSVEIAEDGDFRNPAFSPKGDKLAYFEASRLCVLDLTSGKRVHVKCPAYEFGDFLLWKNDSSLFFPVMSAPRVGAVLYVVPADASSKPLPLRP